jgi:hypothetical protein
VQDNLPNPEVFAFDEDPASNAMQPEDPPVPDSLQMDENVTENVGTGALPPAAQPAAAAPRAPKRGRKLDLMDVETAKAILTEPFDEAAEADRPIPDDCVVDSSGAKAPLPGVLSVFLTGTTLERLGCGSVGAGAGATRPFKACTLAKDAILKDIQFLSTISDFYAYKQAIADADYDELVMRANESDRYNDSNNFEVAVKRPYGRQLRRSALGGTRATRQSRVAASRRSRCRPARRSSRRAPSTAAMFEVWCCMTSMYVQVRL